MNESDLNNSLIRRESAQEATIVKNEDPSESQYECPICINWLDEPLLTSCGHRFCTKCITTWLKKPNPCCPIDNRPLTEKDLFPDNFTRREIKQIRRHCPNTVLGCRVDVSPLEMDAHLLECNFHRPSRLSECPFHTCGCPFKDSDPQQMDLHLHSEMASHLNLLMSAFNQNRQFIDDNRLASVSKLWDAPSKQPSTNDGTTNAVQQVGGASSSFVCGPASDPDLLKALYERIIVLEQQTREKDSKLERLTQQMARNTLDARLSGGVLVWQINQFASRVSTMAADPNHMIYSPGSYTSPFGYRFCVRLNISCKYPSFIGLHVHLMQSENDYHLEWPFRGRIKISMIHTNQNETQHDTIMSKPEILAFSRPTQEISPRGFGFLEYTSISNCLNGGFVTDDTLSLKVQLSIV